MLKGTVLSCEDETCDLTPEEHEVLKNLLVGIMAAGAPVRCVPVMQAPCVFESVWEAAKRRGRLRFQRVTYA